MNFDLQNIEDHLLIQFLIHGEWEDVYEDCVESGGDDGIGQSDVDALSKWC